MRKPSRHMPAAPGQSSEWDFAGICGISIFIAVATSPALIWWPLGFFFPAVITIWTLVCWRRDAQIAEARRDYSICDFARSFDYRVIDTWIIRATFEELSHSYPVRPDDNLADDLGVVGEDLDDCFENIAKRIDRSADDDDVEANPLYDKKVETVRDLVMFLQHQPKVAAREAGNS